MNTSTAAANQPNVQALCLKVADLLPAAGICDPYDPIVLALCDTSFLTPDMTSGAERFCHQIRHATNADTVYLFSRNTLTITCTTSASNDVNNDDTVAIHNALTTMVSDLSNCHQPVQIPDLQVFPDFAKMSVSVIPVDASGRTLAAVIDADEQYHHLNQYCASAVAGIFQCQTSSRFEGFAPTTRQLQCHVFDALNRKFGHSSTQIQSDRYDLFVEDLSTVDVRFDSILDLDKDGEKSVWGWEVVTTRAGADKLATELYQTAEHWNDQFRTALDLHVLSKAAYRYKEICETENLHRLSDIKPLCLRVAPQTLLQQSYTELLRELTEKFVIQGAHLVLEISQKLLLPANASHSEQQNEWQEFAQTLNTLREEFGIRIALDEFGAGNSSLARLKCLDPDIVRIDKSITHTAGQPVIALLEKFSQQSLTRKAAPFEVILQSDENTTAVQQGMYHSTIHVDELSSA